MIDENVLFARFEDQTMLTFLPNVENYKYNPANGWWAWDGRVWVGSGKDCPELYAALVTLIESVQSMVDDPGRMLDDDRKKKLKSYWKVNAANIQRAITLMSSLPQYRTNDIGIAEPLGMVNCRNGIINLATGNVEPHDRAYGFTTIIDYEYTPNKHSQRWNEFLESSLPDPNVRVYLQEELGYAMSGWRLHENIIMFIGSGRNGKGVITQSINNLLGTMCASTGPDTFRRGVAASGFEMARIATARMWVISEFGRTSAEAEMLKALSGGDRFSAAHKGLDPFEAPPVATMIISSNVTPKALSPRDGALWMRLRCINFDVSFEGREDVYLKREIAEQFDGLFSWLIDGALRVTARERMSENIPERVIIDTNSRRWEADQLNNFIQACVEEREGYYILPDTMEEAYKAWVSADGGKAQYTKTELARELKSGVYLPQKTYRQGSPAQGRKWAYYGYALTDEGILMVNEQGYTNQHKETWNVR